MRILLCTATRFEINPLLNNFMVSEVKSKEIEIYYYKGHQITVLITGPGIATTSFLLGKILSQQSYDLCINAGTCGTFVPKFKIGQVVQVMEDTFADFGAEDHEQFLTHFDLNFSQPNTFPFENGQLHASFEFKSNSTYSLPKAKGITVQKAHGNVESIRRVVKQFNPEIESMEGAAFFYACRFENIPCMQIRAVSNLVEKRNKENWNLNLAVSNLTETLIQILQSLN